MSSIQERHRNNVRAGLFVTVTGLLTIAVLLVINDITAIFGSTTNYMVTFPVSSGVQNLTRGSEVRIGGMRMGLVTEVRPNLTEQPFHEIIVEFNTDSAVTLYTNAVAVIGAPLIGAESWIDIFDVGSDQEGAVLSQGDTLTGTESSLLTTLLGPDAAQQSEGWFASITKFTALLARLPDDYAREILPILDDAGMTMDDLRVVVAAIRDEDWPRWSASINEIMANVTETSENLKGAIEDGRGLVADADEAVAKVDALIADNRADIDHFIDSMREAGDDVTEITDRIGGELYDQVDEIVKTAQAGLDSFVRVGGQLEQELATISPNLEETLANARLASEQFKLATAEVRRSPWKLLYQPDDKEYEYQLLYEAARSFAVAAADLDAASKSVERILNRYGDRLEDDEGTLQQLRDHLVGSFNRYQETQERLMDVITADD